MTVEQDHAQFIRACVDWMYILGMAVGMVALLWVLITEFVI